MKKAKGIISALLIMVIGSLLLTSAVSANSGEMSWRGVSATGAMIADENCPIVVEKELLTFDINELPNESYNSEDKFLSYTDSVTAQYTFYNPADYAVTATLAFPFGTLPSYIYFITGGDYEDRYGVSVNGSPIQAEVRHTLSYPYEDFRFENDLPKLIDGYIDDDFYKPDTPVHCLTFSVSDLKVRIDHGYCIASFVWDGDSGKIRLAAKEYNSIKAAEDGLRVGFWASRNVDTINIWFIGELPPMPEWELYTDSTYRQKAEGTVKLIESSETTFRQFALQSYDLKSGISETDWYNAMVLDLKNNDDTLYGGVTNCTDMHFDLTHRLLRWYEYEITLQPGERITNTVTAPVYPTIDTDYNPNICSYIYLLSPAKTWSDFGALDITVNTPFYILESSIEGFEKTDSGYALSLDGLPEGELQFTVSKSKNAFPAIHPLEMIIYGVQLLPLLIVVIVLVAESIKARKRKIESR